MRFASWLAGALTALALALPAAPARAGATVHVVHSEFTASEGDEAGVRGRFRLSDVTVGERTFQRFSILVRGLDAGDAADPQYEVVLDDGIVEADLGALRLSSTGTRGWLRFDTRRDTLPEGITSLAGFAGGTVHLRLDGTDVASGSIPSFVDPDGDDQGSDSPTGTAAFGFGSTLLGDPATQGPLARVTVWASNSYLGVSQGLSVSTAGFETGTYTVVLTGDTTETLGTFEVRSFWGFEFGGFLLSTQRGDEIPGGMVGALAGRGIEIRAEDGTVVLSGTFPSLN